MLESKSIVHVTITSGFCLCLMKGQHNKTRQLSLAQPDISRNITWKNWTLMDMVLKSNPCPPACGHLTLTPNHNLDQRKEEKTIEPSSTIHKPCSNHFTSRGSLLDMKRTFLLTKYYRLLKTLRENGNS